MKRKRRRVDRLQRYTHLSSVQDQDTVVIYDGIQTVAVDSD